MKKYTEEELKDAHKQSIFHQEVVEKSKHCGCFCCEAVFSPGEIDSWVDAQYLRGRTAICPRCGIDAVLGSASGLPVTDKKFLRSMRKRWFF